MPGIYLHIPFCKQACHYCDFHFSTSIGKKEEMVQALAQELSMRKETFSGQTVETIYFGGGTPSLLSNTEIQFLLDAVYAHYDVSDDPEITLEANPDDLTSDKIKELAASPVNRLSIGVQSFFETDLKMMNRAHNAEEALVSLKEAVQYFDNISVDLIYGIPGMTNEQWKQNVETILALGIPHISSYALTVEPKTALKQLIASGKIPEPSEEAAHTHFTILTQLLAETGFIHYELSNFGKPGYFSRNNSAYWLGKSYIGIGPSAHSFDGITRSWNVSNNSLYLKSMASGILPFEAETLSAEDCYNEYVMTGLRTIWGVSLEKIRTEFGQNFETYLLKNAAKYIADAVLSLENGILTTTSKGKFLTDGIASDLFFVG